VEEKKKERRGKNMKIDFICFLVAVVVGCLLARNSIVA
jgi:hypothetical protein